MAKVDKYFIGSKTRRFDYLDKDTNVSNNIGYMLNRTNIMFKYDGLPKTIPSKELELLLQTNGFGVFVKIEDEYYIVNGGLGGVTDVYNRPTNALVSIPYLNYNRTLEIGSECVLVSNDTLGIGLLPLYEKYVTLLNENMITMLLSNVNKRVQTLISANDDNTVASAKEFLDNLHLGKLGVIAESKLFDSLKVNQASSKEGSLIDLIEFEQYIKASLYNEVGLSANFNMKKERITKEEFTTNSDNLFPLIDDMLNCRRKSLEEINELFGLEITVDFNSSWDYRDEENLVINPREQDKDDLPNDDVLDPIIEEIENSETETIVETIDETIDETNIDTKNVTLLEDLEDDEPLEDDLNIVEDEPIVIDDEEDLEDTGVDEGGTNEELEDDEDIKKVI